MEIRTLVDTSATVTRIAKLREGDTYKRIFKPSYGEPELRFGIVTSLLSNGSDGGFTALEYTTASYNAVKIEGKIFQSTDDLAVFPATPEELIEHFDELEKVAARGVREAREALQKAEALQFRVHNVVRGQLKLSAPVVQSPALEVSE